MTFHRFALCIVATFSLVAAVPAPRLEWAFLGMGAAHRERPDTAIVRRPGSTRHFAEADLQDMTHAPDWFPQGHPPAPRPVLAPAGGAYACGYCHLPTGVGRPENARLQGLPASYIADQVHAFASGARRAAIPDYGPSVLMAQVARAVSPADLKAAAIYFSRIEPRSTTRVVEAATIPRATPRAHTYRFDPAGRERLGERIVEGPVDWDSFEARDPRTAYTAYVPVGAIARGRAIAIGGAPGVPACVSCHGPKLAGMGGGSPTYAARQLAGFRSGARNDSGAAPMRAVAARLDDSQIVAVAAYAASRPPWTRADVPTIMEPAATR